MNVQIQNIKTALDCLMAFFILLAAYFKLRDSWQNAKDREATRAKYGALWRKIDQSGVLEIPEKIIIKSLEFKDTFGDIILKISGDFKTQQRWMIEYYSVTLFLSIGNYLISFNLFIVHFVVLLGFHIYRFAFGEKLLLINRWFVFWLEISFNTAIFALCFSGLTKWLSLATQLSIIQLTILSILLLPALGFVFVWLLIQVVTVFDILFPDNLTDEEDRLFSIVGYVFGISLPLSMISLLIGHYFSPDAYIPKTTQMLLFNLLFDALTLATTYFMLSRSVGSKKRFPISVAVMLDIFFAGIFACLSLFFGLYLTNNSLSFYESVNVLIGLKQDGSSFEIGPYFWIMHTTFIPTFIYTSIILISLIGKGIVLPFAKIVKRGEVIEKPHDLTAMTFTFIAVSLGLVTKLL